MDGLQMERVIARVLENVRRAGDQAGAAAGLRSGFELPVGVSARHVHLTQAHVEQLFGPGHQLRPKKTLMGGQFACEEQVTLVGAALRALENVRVLGPVRGASQVEVSRSDCVRLGVCAPLRESGDLADASPIALVGPCGAVYLEHGLIVAKRHIHFSLEDAAAAGVSDGEILRVGTGKPGRGGLLGDVVARVRADFTLEMHMDTDEANALGLATGDRVFLEGCG